MARLTQTRGKKLISETGPVLEEFLLNSNKNTFTFETEALWRVGPYWVSRAPVRYCLLYVFAVAVSVYFTTSSSCSVSVRSRHQHENVLPPTWSGRGVDGGGDGAVGNGVTISHHVCYARRTGF